MQIVKGYSKMSLFSDDDNRLDYVELKFQAGITEIDRPQVSDLAVMKILPFRQSGS